MGLLGVSKRKANAVIKSRIDYQLQDLKSEREIQLKRLQEKKEILRLMNENCLKLEKIVAYLRNSDPDHIDELKSKEIQGELNNIKKDNILYSKKCEELQNSYLNQRSEDDKFLKILFGESLDQYKNSNNFDKEIAKRIAKVKGALSHDVAKFFSFIHMGGGKKYIPNLNIDGFFKKFSNLDDKHSAEKEINKILTPFIGKKIGEEVIASLKSAKKAFLDGRKITLPTVSSDNNIVTEKKYYGVRKLLVKLAKLDKIQVKQRFIDDLESKYNLRSWMRDPEFMKKNTPHVVAVHNIDGLETLSYNSYVSPKGPSYASSATVVWSSDENKSVPVNLYAGYNFGFVLNQDKIDIKNAEFRAAGTFGNIITENDMVTKEGSTHSLKRSNDYEVNDIVEHELSSKYPHKQGQIRGGENGNVYVTDYSRWDAIEKTWNSDPSLDRFARNVFWRYHRKQFKMDREYEEILMDSDRGQRRNFGKGSADLNEMLFQAKDPNESPIKGMLINARDRASLMLKNGVAKDDQYLTRFLNILENKPDLPLFIYDISQKNSNLMKSYDNDVAQKAIKSVINKGFSSTDKNTTLRNFIDDILEKFKKEKDKENLLKEKQQKVIAKKLEQLEKQRSAARTLEEKREASNQVAQMKREERAKVKLQAEYLKQEQALAKERQAMIKKIYKDCKSKIGLAQEVLIEGESYKVFEIKEGEKFYIGKEKNSIIVEKNGINKKGLTLQNDALKSLRDRLKEIKVDKTRDSSHNNKSKAASHSSSKSKKRHSRIAPSAATEKPSGAPRVAGITQDAWMRDIIQETML